MPAAIARLLAWVRRTFFWLTPSSKTSTEQGPELSQDHALVLAVTQPSVLPRWRQLRYAGRVLSPAERRILAIALVGFLLFMLAGATVLSLQHLATVPTAGGVFTEALVGEPQAINPIDAPANDADDDLASVIYSGLFRMQGTEAVPDLAESYAWSDDGKILTVTLQKDARFHNGNPITADDVQFTVEAIQDPTRSSLLAPLFRGVKASVIDEHTVQFNLDQPDVTFLTALTAGIMPSDLWQDIPAATARLANLNLKPIGSGPYMVKSFTRDSYGAIRSYTLERFEKYYGIKPYFKTIVFQFYPDRQSAEDALKSDLVDALSFITSDEMEKFNSTARWQTVTLEIPQQTVAFFNLKDKTLMALGTNRQELLAAYQDMAAVAEMPYPFMQPTTSTAYDPDSARKLLQETGWVMPGNDSVRVYQKPDPKKPGPVPISTTSSTKLILDIMVPDEPVLQKVADILKRQWSLLGAQVEVKPMDSRQLLKKSSRERDAQVILWNLLLRPDQDLFPIWWSGQATERGMNFSGLADKEIDTLIELTKSTTSTQTLEASRQRLAVALLNRTPGLFLVRPTYAYVISNRVKGVQTVLRLARPSDRFENLNQWYLKTGLRWK
jgi:peptide/nickel transport system substrate-binding protein